MNSIINVFKHENFSISSLEPSIEHILKAQDIDYHCPVGVLLILVLVAVRLMILLQDVEILVSDSGPIHYYPITSWLPFLLETDLHKYLLLEPSSIGEKYV